MMIRLVVGLLLMFALGIGVVGAAEQIDINTASAEELAEALKGIGAKKAEAIVQYREENGPFTAVEQLTEVKGIGPKTLENNLDLVTVGEPDVMPSDVEPDMTEDGAMIDEMSAPITGIPVPATEAEMMDNQAR